MTTALSLDTFRRCWEAAAPPAPSSGRGCIEQILVTFPLLFFFFCSLRQHLMCFATLCKRWLPPPPASSLLHFSAGSWVWPWGFLGSQESCSCWTRRPSLNAVEARCPCCGSSSCRLVDLHKMDRTEEATPPLLQTNHQRNGSNRRPHNFFHWKLSFLFKIGWYNNSHYISIHIFLSVLQLYKWFLQLSRSTHNLCKFWLIAADLTWVKLKSG